MVIDRKGRGFHCFMNNSKVLILCFVCLISLTLVGCDGKRAKKENTSDSILFSYDGSTYTEEYALYCDNGPRYYYDVESGNAVVFCFEAGCEHKRTARDNDGNVILQGCAAYDYTDAPVFLYRDNLYFFSSNCLYRADRQGNNRKKIVELTTPYEVNESFCFYSNEAFYIAYSLSYEYSFVKKNDGSSEWRAGKQKEKPEAGVLRIPFSGGKEEVIFHSDENYAEKIVGFWPYDGQVVFIVQSMDRPSNNVDLSKDGWQELVEEEQRHTFLELYSYSESTGEVKRIVEPRPGVGIYFYSEVYGVIEKEPGTMELYRYNGERVASTEGNLFFGVISDSGIIGWDYDSREAVLLDESSGKILKRSSFKREDFTLYAVVGKSCYGRLPNSEGNYTRVWIASDDFWNGNRKGIRMFSEY